MSFYDKYDKITLNYCRFLQKNHIMGKRILIVEDHADIRRLIRMTLEFEDHEIHEAANADEGLLQARQERPDLLLLDVMMPGTMDGLGLCRLVKNDPDLNRPHVILLTARGQSQDIEAGLAAGADAYLLKPFSPLKLIETINQLES